MRDIAIKKIKGFSSAYPNMCDLKLLFNTDKTWITIQDNIETSITIKLSDLSDIIGTCKDCRHRDPEDKKCDCGHDIQWQLPREDDWYCKDFERKITRMEETDDTNNQTRN